MDIKIEAELASKFLFKKVPKIAKMDAVEKSYFSGIALTARLLALTNEPHANPFASELLESQSFRAGYASVEKDVVIPSVAELHWISTRFISLAFRTVIDGSLSVVRLDDGDLVFIASGTDIERIFTLCEKLYSVKISKPISGLKTKSATLTLHLSECSENNQLP
tara:strand:- start:16060 stop:16554 length:495 start_codon:yes stop_codon:yes gene_type:complete